MYEPTAFNATETGADFPKISSLTSSWLELVASRI
jgi:hypothetical protein